MAPANHIQAAASWLATAAHPTKLLAPNFLVSSEFLRCKIQYRCKIKFLWDVIAATARILRLCRYRMNLFHCCFFVRRSISCGSVIHPPSLETISSAIRISRLPELDKKYLPTWYLLVIGDGLYLRPFIQWAWMRSKSYQSVSFLKVDSPISAELRYISCCRSHKTLYLVYRSKYWQLPIL